MKEIKVSGTSIATLVDDEDFSYLINFSIYMRNKVDKYPTVWLDGRSIPIHQLIMKGKLVDHIDGNVFNNQRSNLRFVTKQQNSFNAKKCKVARSSKYKGVCLTKYGWKATICINYKNKHLGYFDIEEQAAIAYDNAARQLFGEYAHLNFKD